MNHPIFDANLDISWSLWLKGQSLLFLLCRLFLCGLRQQSLWSYMWYYLKFQKSHRILARNMGLILHCLLRADLMSMQAMPLDKQPELLNKISKGRLVDSLGRIKCEIDSCYHDEASWADDTFVRCMLQDKSANCCNTNFALMSGHVRATYHKSSICLCIFSVVWVTSCFVES